METAESFSAPLLSASISESVRRPPTMGGSQTTLLSPMKTRFYSG